MTNTFIPPEIERLYEVKNYRHAAEVLATSCKAEFNELMDALTRFRLSTEDIRKPGGNESEIPKRVATLLRPKGWFETRIHGDLLVTVETHAATESREGQETRVTKRIERTELRLENVIDGHKVDFIKNRVAFDLEWNSKDQTFDRDLYAFRAFHEADVISAAVLMTRSESLNVVFRSLGLMPKYGASTTWMGKLTYRIKAGRSGGCPVLVLGITPKLIED